jgi:hypothetical protein
MCDTLQALGLPETCTLSKVTLRSLTDRQMPISHISVSCYKFVT